MIELSWEAAIPSTSVYLAIDVSVDIGMVAVDSGLVKGTAENSSRLLFQSMFPVSDSAVHYKRSNRRAAIEHLPSGKASASTEQTSAISHI
jgi:hypothetical protein